MLATFPDHRATIYCRCGHHAWAILPGDVLLPEIKRRARCTACGEFGVTSVSIRGAGPGDPPLGGWRVYPDGRRERYEPPAV